MRPVTKHDIISAVRDVGLKEGSTVMVHTSLSRIGYVCGGAQTVIEALTEAAWNNAVQQKPFSKVEPLK